MNSLNELRKNVIRGLRIFAGILALLLGIIGLVLPVMPQIPFLVAAFVLLSPDMPWLKSFAAWLSLKYPAMAVRIKGFIRRHSRV